VATVRLCFDHELPCTSERFWSGFLQTETISAFHRQDFGFTKFDVLRHDVNDAFVRRTVDCHFPVTLDGTLRRLLRSEFCFVENGEFERATRTWRYTWVPAVLPSKIHIHGSLHIEDLTGAEERCRRRGELDVVAEIPVLGAAIERAAARLLSASWDRSAVELGEWLRRGKWG
jgi:Protein of unknown function (DUF2505)